MLIQAASEGKLDFVKWLIESGADVNMTMGSGWTALHAASMNGRKEVCMMYIQGRCPLHSIFHTILPNFLAFWYRL